MPGEAEQIPPQRADNNNAMRTPPPSSPVTAAVDSRPAPGPASAAASAVRRTRRVAVVYHFFAHYRAAVMRELCLHSRPDFEIELVGDVADPTGGGIAAWDLTAEPGPVRLTRARCRPLRGPVLWQHGLIRLALRRDLDAIIYLGNALWPATWLSAAIARLSGKRVYFWTHGWTEPDQGLKAKVRRWFYRLAHGLLLYGHMAKMVGLEQGFDPDRLHVIYNSLDVDRQRQIRDAITPADLARVRAECFPDAPSRPLVICTSRLTAGRRFDLLIEALALIQREHGRPINLLLVGDGPEQSALEALARERSVNVHFHGPCYDDDELAPLIMAANVTVAPGNVGLTAMHSLVFGVPVITHDDWTHQGPEFETIIEGRTGGFFRRDDVADLARAVLRFTEHEQTPDQVRRACMAVIDRFYNPRVQRLAIEAALRGQPANDLADHAGWLNQRSACVDAAHPVTNAGRLHAGAGPGHAPLPSFDLPREAANLR